MKHLRQKIGAALAALALLLGQALPVYAACLCDTGGCCAVPECEATVSPCCTTALAAGAGETSPRASQSFAAGSCSCATAVTPALPPATIPAHTEGELATTSLDTSSSLEIDRPAPADAAPIAASTAHAPRPPSIPSYLRHACFLI
jgi:hypothetical protein